MALNRTELKTQIDTVIVATLAIATHRAYLKDDQSDSLVFRKDIIASETPAGGNVTVDFSDKDLATIITTSNLAVSFTGMENGDVKYMVITKNAGNSITFTGATNRTNFTKLINQSSGAVPFIVYNKNNSISVQALYETIIEGTLSDINAANPYKFPTCEAVSDAIDAIPIAEVKYADAAIGTWNMDTTEFRSVTIPAVVMANESRIRGVVINIYEDGNNFSYPLDYFPPSETKPAGSFILNLQGSGSLDMRRLTNGIFDGSGFNSTSQNRGYARFFYETS
jgi:hypothetical protein